MPEFNQPARKRINRSGSSAAASLQPKKKKARPQKKKTQAQSHSKQVYGVKQVSKPVRATKTKKKNRQNMVIYYVFFLILTIIVFAVLSMTVLFKVTEIEIIGESIYSDEQIIETGGLLYGVNLIRFDEKTPETLIRDKLHHLDDVKVRKKFSNKIIVEVEGAKESAYILKSGKYYLISEKGRVLEELSLVDDRKYPIVRGFEAIPIIVGDYIESEHERKKDIYFDIMEAVRKSEIVGITEIDLTDHLNITLDYENRVEMIIGTSAEIELKLVTARELLKTDIEENEDGTLRLTNPQQPTFLPSDAMTAPLPVIAETSEENEEEVPEEDVEEIIMD